MSSKKQLSHQTTTPCDEDGDEVDSRWVESSLDSGFSNLRLDVVVTQLYGEIPSRAVAAKLIEGGAVLLNGRPAKCSVRTAAGDTIALNTALLENPSTPPEPQAIPLDILFEDAEILVINKPAGLVVHPGAGVRDGTLVNAVLAHCGQGLPTLGGPARAGIVHRLDKETSGVMVVAKTLRALSGLSCQFARHEQTRRYLALVNGVPVPAEGLIATWHGRDPKHRIRFAVLAEGVGKEARMRYETREIFSDYCSLQACSLFTGRTHQIRVQMRHVGCALLGDTLYGAPHPRLRNDKALWVRLEPLLVRQMLHAELLTLQHPVSSEPMNFVAPPPADFERVLALLRETWGARVIP
jgi:23S rRNA pseudouridine1911/1915/1917 synthase